jgi:hypothetical protein
MAVRSIRAWAYSVVVATFVANGIFIVIANAKLTPSRVVGVLLLLGVLLRAVLTRTVTIGGLAGGLIIAWCSLSLAIDIAIVSDPVLLRFWLNLLSGVVWFFVVVNLTPRWTYLESALIGIAWIVGALAIVVLAMRYLSIDTTGILSTLTARTGNTFRLKLISREPNIFGAVVATIAVLIIPRLVSRGHDNRIAIASFCLTLIALFASLSKGPWAAFLVGTFVYLSLTRSRRVGTLTFSLLAIAVVGGLLALTMMPNDIAADLLRPLNAIVRLSQIHDALIDIRAHPMSGNGTFSFGVIWPDAVREFGGSPGTGWIGQTVVAVTHDTGIFGLLVFSTFLMVIFRRALKAIRRSRPVARLHNARSFSVATVGAGAVLLTMGLATTVYALPMYWAVLGLLACIPRWLRDVPFGGENARGRRHALLTRQVPGDQDVPDRVI